MKLLFAIICIICLTMTGCQTLPGASAEQSSVSCDDQVLSFQTDEELSVLERDDAKEPTDASRVFSIEFLDRGMNGAHTDGQELISKDLAYWNQDYLLLDVEKNKDLIFEGILFHVQYESSSFGWNSSSLSDRYSFKGGWCYINHDTQEIITRSTRNYYFDREEMKSKPNEDFAGVEEKIQSQAEEILRQYADQDEYLLDYYKRVSSQAEEGVIDSFEFSYRRYISGIKTRDRINMIISARGKLLSLTVDNNDFKGTSEEIIAPFLELDLNKEMDSLIQYGVESNWSFPLKCIEIKDAFLALTPKDHEPVMIVFARGTYDYTNPETGEIEEGHTSETIVIRDTDFVPSGTWFTEPVEELLDQETAVQIAIQYLESKPDYPADNIEVEYDYGPILNTEKKTWMVPLSYRNKATEEFQRGFVRMNAINGEILDSGFGGGPESPFPED